MKLIKPITLSNHPACLHRRHSMQPSWGKSVILCILLSIPLFTLTACHRDCVCKGYNGGSHTYSEEEVDAQNVTCANMIYQAGQQFYAVCDWE